MNIDKTTILYFLAVCIIVNAAAVKRKSVKTKIKKVNIANLGAPPCGCQKPRLDIVNCGCRGPIIESALAPIEIAKPACQSPIIDIPNYRYVDSIELNPLTGLFPSIEIPNCGVLSAPITLPNVEYFKTMDLPCGCPPPKCGCRAPAVKLPAGAREIVAAIDVPSAYTYGIASVIDLPPYAPAPVVQISGLGPLAPACGCQGPCNCPEYQILPCGCQTSCSCPGISISPCGCQGPCNCPEYQILPCGCQTSCSCPGIPISACGCQGPCSCPEYQILLCGCQGSCSCPGIAMSSCGCPGPCGCSNVPLSCGCQGSCKCPGMPVGLLPSIEVPCGCGCGLPGCNCAKYLRQVTLQPPFL